MRILTLSLAILGAFSSVAQKIKYKEIFGLLSTGQYESAEPFLKQYLAETKDNPNAFLFLGIIYHEKSLKGDILRNTNETINLMDSAVVLYNTAYKAITEKEIKKNSDYYAKYSKRDLRTGKYGVKLSDVQYEIEKSIEALNERIDKVNMVRHYFIEAEQLYNRTNELYISLQSVYPGEKELFLRADDEVVLNLKTLSLRFDSCAKAFEHYKISLGNIPNPGYNQAWNLVAIKNFKTEGIQVTDFYGSNLQIWDYKRFADDAITIIEKEVVPTREKLVRYDIEINKLRKLLITDSVSVKSDLTKLVDNLLSDRLQKFDSDPLPLNVLGLKVAKLEYESTVIENRKKGDVQDVYEQLNLVRTEHKTLTKVDSLASILINRNIDEEAKNYAHFVSNTFNSSLLLKSYIKTEKDFTVREKRKLETEMSLRMKALGWLVAGPDSIPLDLSYSASYFKPLLVEENKFTTGISLKESSKGYFYTITPSRRPDISVNFQVDGRNLNASNLDHVKALATADSGNNIYFVLMYSDTKVNDKYPATVAKIYRSDGLSWSHNVSLSFIPSSIEYLQDSTDLLVRSDSGTTLLDKNGKLKE
jgi:phage anti-repressor protein